jgi:peptide/nickel transport system substrate-binding protein
MKCILIALLVMIPICVFPAPPESNNVLRVGINTFPANLNPIYTTDETSQAVVNKIFDALFEFDSNGAIVNRLVQSFSYTSDTDIQVVLKEGIRFSNGKELTAADVEATVSLLLDERYKYPYASNLGFIAGVTAEGKYSLRLKTKNPVAAWRNSLTFKVLCAEEIKGFAATDLSSFRKRRLSGTGPYMIAAVEPPNRVTLKRNTHSRSKSLYPALHYTVVAYPYLVPLKLLNREIDLCELQPEDIPVYREKKSWQKSFKILKYSKFGYSYLVFNLKNPAITSEIRQLLYNALVAGNFTSKFLRDRGEAVKSPFMLLSPEVETKRFPIDKISPPKRLKILTNSESQMRKRFILFLKKELRPLGIELEPVFMEYHSFLDCLKRKDFHLALSGFLLDIDYDMNDILASGSYFNYAGFSSPEMDRLLSAGLRELNPQKRKIIYLEAHNLWKRDLPLLPLFNLYYYVGVAQNVSIPTDTCRLMGSSGDFLQNIRCWKINTNN